MSAMKRWCLALMAPAMLGLGCAGGGEVESMQRAEGQEVRVQEAALASAVFSGTVKDSTGKVIPGATVTINGVARTTDTAGKYFVSITAATAGYNLSVSKAGYGPAAQFLSAGKLNSVHVLPVATVRQINPTVTSTVQVGDVTVTIPANSLVNASGQTVTGTVNVSVAGYSPLGMPGDFTAVNSSGRQVALESVGAFFIGAATSDGGAVNLGQNKTAEVVLKVPTQVRTMPPCVFGGSSAAAPAPTCRLAMWRFDSTTGLWVEQVANIRPTTTSTAFTLIGGPASRPGNIVPSNGGLGTWNADIEKATPACTIIEISNFPLYCYNPANTSPEPGVTINLQLPNSAGTFLTKTDTILSDTPFTVVYNIRANVEEEVGIGFPTNAPADCGTKLQITSTPAPVGGYPVYTGVGGFTRLDSGAPWGGTGFPKDTVTGTNITLSSVIATPPTDPCHSRVKFEYVP